MKKWLLVLGIAACLSGLAACGADKEEETPFISEEEALTYADIVDQINMIVEQNGIAQFAEGSLEAKALESWAHALEEMGSYQGIIDRKADISQDKAVIEVRVKGSKQDAVTQIIIDKKVGITEITTNIKYTFGELMKNAALNTVLGMGTTFVILILICLLISCFNFIPQIQALFGKESSREEVKKQLIDQTIAKIIEQEEELADDGELVAVITAAIAASEDSSITDGFRVRSIRRANTNKWKQA